MKKIYLAALVAILVISCNNGGRQKELQNTPQGRLETGQQYLAANDFINAKKTFNALIEKFPLTDEAKKAQLLIAEIENKEKAQNEADGEKKTLYFKSLKENSSVTIENVTLKFNSITTGNRWIFEHNKYRIAERENKYLLAKVSISSNLKETRIPLVSVYELSDGKLNLLGIMRREFTNEPDGGYTNVDFKYVNTVSFSQAFEISEESLKEKAIFVVVKRNNCSRYESGYYLDTDIERTITKDNNQCDIKNILNVDDFNNDYVVVKILNKNKL